MNGLIERVEALLEAPEKGPLSPVCGANVRRLSYRSHIILYRVSGDDVFIERVIHGARLPKNIK